MFNFFNRLFAPLAREEDLNPPFFKAPDFATLEEASSAAEEADADETFAAGYAFTFQDEGGETLFRNVDELVADYNELVGDVKILAGEIGQLEDDILTLRAVNSELLIWSVSLVGVLAITGILTLLVHVK